MNDVEREQPAIALLSLTDCEAIIEEGLPTFFRVGVALAQVQQRRLYKDRYPSFEAYLRDRWGWSRRTAYDYIAAAAVDERVRTSAQMPSVAHAVALSRLPVDVQSEHAQTVASLSVAGARRHVAEVAVSQPNETAIHTRPRDQKKTGVTPIDGSREGDIPPLAIFLKACSTLVDAGREVLRHPAPTRDELLAANKGRIAAAQMVLELLAAPDLREVETPARQEPVESGPRRLWTPQKMEFLAGLAAEMPRVGALRLSGLINDEFPDEPPVMSYHVIDVLRFLKSRSNGHYGDGGDT